MKIAFVGTGMIGAGLAVNAAMKGHEVFLFYRRNLEQLQQRLERNMNVFVDAGVITAEEAKNALDSIKYSMDMEEVVSGAVMVQESVAENLDTKKEIYRQIQEICGEETIISSSTTAIFPSALSEGALYPKQIIVGHPYNPSYLLPLIEVCGPHTDQQVIDRAVEIYKSMGKEPIVCKKENPGFVVNSLSWAVMNGAIDTVKNGVCSVEDIDKAIMYGPGMRMALTGQILTISLGVQGGLRASNAKYGKDEDQEKIALMNMIADGVDEEIANRPASKGNTVEGIEEFRDKALVELLKIQGML